MYIVHNTSKRTFKTNIRHNNYIVWDYSKYQKYRILKKRMRMDMWTTIYNKDMICITKCIVNHAYPDRPAYRRRDIKPVCEIQTDKKSATFWFHSWGNLWSYYHTLENLNSKSRYRYESRIISNQIYSTTHLIHLLRISFIIITRIS